MGLMAAGRINQNQPKSGREVRLSSFATTGMTSSPNDTSRGRTGISAFLRNFVDPARISDIGRICKWLENEQVAGCHRVVTALHTQEVIGSSPVAPTTPITALRLRPIPSTANSGRIVMGPSPMCGRPLRWLAA